MSLEELTADAKANIAEAKKLDTVEGLRDHLVNTLWPYQQAIVDEMTEIDDAVAEALEHEGDYLQEQTAGIFAGYIQLSAELVAELRRMATGNDILLKRIDAHAALSQQVVSLLQDAAMADGESEEDDDDIADEKEQS